MLPAEHGPASLCEQPIMEAIPFAVSGDLGSPVGDVGFRRLVVLRAAMPVAAVYEHSEAGAREDNVRTHRPAAPGRDREIYSESESARMKD